MKAWRFAEFGRIENLVLGEWPDPDAGDGEVLIRLKFAALNPADRLSVEGRYPGVGGLPLSAGRDGSGIVEHAGANSAFRVGDAVVVLRSEIGITRQGTLAELVAVPERSVARLPGGWSFEEGAAAPLVYLTAWKALVSQGGLAPGQTVLVDGATGGVGIAAIQLAAALGGKVVGLTRDASKHAALLELGAFAAVDANPDGLEDRVRTSLEGGGVDIAIENLGGAYVQAHLALANPGGRILVIGLLAGRTVQVDLGLLLFKQARIEGVHVGQYAPSEAQAAWKTIAETLDRAKARPLIDRVYPMAGVQEAFARLAGGHMGKVLIEVAA